MSLDDLTCEVCGMRYGDLRLYREHITEAHEPRAAAIDDDTQEHITGMPTGSTVREDL